MIEHVGKYWFIYWGLFAGIALLWHQSRRGSASKGLLASLRKNIDRYQDPESPLYDPGLLGRQASLIFIGLALIAVALLSVWFIGQ